MAKMRNDKGLVILFVVVLATVIAFVVYNLTKKNIHWEERLSTNMDQPYDLRLFRDLLKSSASKDFQFITSSLATNLEDVNESNYVFIGKHLVLDSAAAQNLIDFVKKGNDALIITSAPSPQLLSLLTKEGVAPHRYLAHRSDSIDLHIAKENSTTDYRFIYRDKQGVQFRLWSYFSDSMDQKTEIGFFTAPGTDEQFCNFFSVGLGQGRVYFHTEPILFSNYHIIEDQGFHYVSKIISYLPDRPILWDNYHNTYHYSPGSQPYSSSPLKYIFSQPALRYAWFILLGGVVLFVVFKSKREQRIIPIMPKVQNTSIDFAKSLGILYFQAESPKYIAQEMMKLFSDFNRKRYRVPGRPLDPDFKPSLARKAKVDLDLVERIYVLERKVLHDPTAGMNKLTPLYYALQEYYQKAKK